MREAKGNMLQMDCDVFVVSTNGFVTSTGKAVMGRGIAKHIADMFPDIPYTLGNLIMTKGNKVHYLGEKNGTHIVSFPVKPNHVVADGTNTVSHAKYQVGDTVPGFHAKADPQLIQRSAHQLLSLINAMSFKPQTVLIPRVGCGAGELNWDDSVRMPLSLILDDRFIACTF